MQLEAHLLLCQRCLWCRHSALRSLCLGAALRDTRSHYDLLGVKPDASLEEIKAAFFHRSKQLHPDSDPSNPGLHTQFVALSKAYKVLRQESTRREYDSSLRDRDRRRERQAFSGTPQYTQTSRPDRSEHVRYWEQFRYAGPHNFSAEQSDRKRRRNRRLVLYCVLVMMGSLTTHYFGFRKLEELHNSFMDEKDRVITEIYNESKGRARANGFQKQTEILRQRHAEFAEKYRLRSRGPEGGQQGETASRGEGDARSVK
ncbi:dnaJ homolog subfamily C member 4 [Lepisosteus oculatus]|uniref:dnaJ homolog subfamily C member 4 n=1 Tax=Lepisosteus oculatus TaxID=7918 RepID=UPI0035F52C5D